MNQSSLSVNVNVDLDVNVNVCLGGRNALQDMATRQQAATKWMNVATTVKWLLVVLVVL